MNEALLQCVRVPGIDRLVAGAVVHSEAGVLVVRRSLTDDFLPGVEELPSGGCDEGETVAEALNRELQEEIGWRGPVVVDGGFVTHFDYVTGSGATARQHTFSVPLGDQVVRLSPEHSSWRWLRRADLDTSDLTAKPGAPSRSGGPTRSTTRATGASCPARRVDHTPTWSTLHPAPYAGTRRGICWRTRPRGCMTRSRPTIPT